MPQQLNNNNDNQKTFNKVPSKSLPLKIFIKKLKLKIQILKLKIKKIGERSADLGDSEAEIQS